MSADVRSRRSVVSGLWRSLDTCRRIVANLVFVALVVLVVVAVWPAGGPRVPRRAALVVTPRGVLVEQLTGDPLDRAIARLLGSEPAETLLADLLDGIEAAADDDRIQAMLLDLDRFAGGGLSKLRAVRSAVDRFRSTGKTVIATADIMGRSGFYVASGADEIIVRPDGMILIDGYAATRTYYREGIDRLGIDMHVFKVGAYKTYTEPWERSDMSAEAREAYLEWLDQLWTGWLEDVAAARGLTADTLRELIENADTRLLAADGDLMQAALDGGLVDELAHRDRVRERLIELVGEEEDANSFHQIGLDAYLETLDDQARFGRGRSGPGVGVIVLRGDMVRGSRSPGVVGGDSSAALIRRALHDDDVKALVLRIDSGGGLSLVGEQLRREVELVREAGKPVVASMSSVAASAAYHVAAAADEVWATPATVTGSIGVFAMFPTFQRPLERYLGMTVDGVGTTPFAGAVGVDRELPERVRTMIQAGVEWSYREFVEDIAVARGMTFDEVDAVARGRIWSGTDALALGLIDRIGDLEEAVASAAELAQLGEEYQVSYLEQELDTEERLLVGLLSRVAQVIRTDRRPPLRRVSSMELIDALISDPASPVRFGAEDGPIAHSLLETD